MSVLVKMKDGRVFCGDLWTWRPLEGWFSIVDNEAPEKIMLDDVESAVNRGQRYNPRGETRDEDLLERAKKHRAEAAVGGEVCSCNEGFVQLFGTRRDVRSTLHSASCAMFRPEAGR